MTDELEMEKSLAVVDNSTSALAVVENEKRDKKRNKQDEYLALPEHIILEKEYPEAPAGIFADCGDNYFLDLTKVFKRQLRDYHFFLKFQKYVPVTHFAERPERYSNTYEKKYWNLTLFNRFCCLLRQKAKHLATSPFSLSGDYAMFEKETLYTPQECPIYVERSRLIMTSNLNRFKKVIYATHRDAYDSDSLRGNILEEADASIQLKKFIRGRAERTDDFDTSKDDVSMFTSGGNV